MQVPSTTKTEKRALNALERIIDEHLTMDHQFKADDKEMSWDGFLILFKENNGDQSKKNIEGRVPVQIKGHNGLDGNVVNHEKISYPVDLDDLEAYASEKGVLYFQIFVNQKKSAVFYISLYPSRIADYLEIASKKGNKTSINLPFTKLKKNPETLYYIAKQFHQEALKQGTVYTPLVKDRIRQDEFQKLNNVKFNVIGVTDISSVLQRFSSGDVCLYGTTGDNNYERPLEWSDEFVLIEGENIEKSIYVNQEEYYNHFLSMRTSRGEDTIRLSKNLELHLSKTEFKYRPVSTLKEVYTDAKFLLELDHNKTITIGDHDYNYETQGLSPAFREKLRYTVDLCETLNMIGFTSDKCIDEYTKEEHRQFVEIVNVRLGVYNKHFNEGINKYVWRFGNKYVPVIVIKHNESIELVDALYTTKISVIIPYTEDGQEKGYQVPLFIYQDIEVFYLFFCH